MASVCICEHVDGARFGKLPLAIRIRTVYADPLPVFTGLHPGRAWALDASMANSRAHLYIHYAILPHTILLKSVKDVATSIHVKPPAPLYLGQQYSGVSAPHSCQATGHQCSREPRREKEGRLARSYLCVYPASSSCFGNSLACTLRDSHIRKAWSLF